MGKVFLIASGKGGVGKTTVASNLAAAFPKEMRVLVFDADLDLANLDIAFGMRDLHVYDLQDLYFGRCSFSDAAIPVPDHPNVTAVFAPLRREVSVTVLLRFLREQVESCRERYDYILVDCPAGIGPALEILSCPRYATVLVTTPDRTAVSDAERAAEQLYRKGAEKIRLIVNRVRPQLIRKSRAPDIDDIIDTTAVQLIGLIPEDVSVICAGNSDCLVLDMPRARSRKAFLNIARRLNGESVDLDRFS